MQFNYAKENREFEEEWKKKRILYAKEGMNEKSIQIMYDFDREEFRDTRNYCLHNESSEEVEKKKNALDMEKLSYDNIREGCFGRYGWIEEIEDKRLYRAIKRLKMEDIEILTLLFEERYKITEIAEMQGVRQPAISKKWKRIKKFVKSFRNGL